METVRFFLAMTSFSTVSFFWNDVLYRLYKEATMKVVSVRMSSRETSTMVAMSPDL